MQVFPLLARGSAAGTFLRGTMANRPQIKFFSARDEKWVPSRQGEVGA